MYVVIKSTPNMFEQKYRRERKEPDRSRQIILNVLVCVYEYINICFKIQTYIRTDINTYVRVYVLTLKDL